jgi:hypothetical protein
VRSHAKALPVQTGRAGAGSIFRRSMIAGAVALFALWVLSGRAAAAECPNEELRIEKSSTLPDCRAYEQVTPTEKEVGVFGGEVPSRVAVQGGAIGFSTRAPLPGSLSAPLINVYVAHRHESGWQTTPVLPPQIPTPGGSVLPTFDDFSPDLSKSILLTGNPPLVPGAALNVENLYRVQEGPNPYELITTPQQGPGIYRYTMESVGASADDSRIYFSSLEPLLPGVEAPSRQLYEFTNGNLALAGVLPDGSLAMEAEPAANLGQRRFNSVSADGRRLYFKASGAESLVIDGQLYVREDGQRTIDVSRSRRAIPDPNGTIGAGLIFWAASGDGNKALFTSRSALTEDSNTGTDAGGEPIDTGANLYLSNIDADTLTNLSVDSSPLDAETGAEVLGVVGASQDASYVYFVARGELAAGAQKGSPNLYLWHEGSVHYLATLLESDSGNWSNEILNTTSRVSPDGRHVLLSSAASLTGYDNTDAVTGEPDTEIYVYSDDTGQFACASCRPDGAQPKESTGVVNGFANVSGATYAKQYISDDGDTVVFATRESLVPRDVNGIQDVYEYRNGEVRLLSPGTSEFEARFEGISPDGVDAFISTVEQLTPSDHDGLADIYDVRRDGGYPAPSTGGAICVGSECERGGDTRPAPPPTGSATLNGPGNPRRVCRKSAKHASAKARQAGCGHKKKATQKSQKKSKKGHKRSHARHGDKGVGKRGSK